MPRQQREQAILSAASAEFGASSYVGAHMSVIAANADVSKALVLSYFGSKEDLYVACVERAGETLAAAIGDAIPVPSGGASDGERVLEAIFTTLADRPSDWPVVYDRTVPAGRARDAAREQRTILREQAMAGVTRALAEVGLDDPDDLSAATVVWEHIVSALVQWWQQHPEQSAADMTARARRILAALSDRPVPTA
ncbi:TetR/AcrR family transcriptional regulator [Mycolicibacterium brisbanense]|nr:TetR/AcrR family transcriptional regulator [Mycolicibacterium brisbanense]MCV7161892.1 TetR/AcrR family transcriptional regulator [Mycolicibacterium brisbanense]